MFNQGNGSVIAFLIALVLIAQCAYSIPVSTPMVSEHTREDLHPSSLLYFINKDVLSRVSSHLTAQDLAMLRSTAAQFQSGQPLALEDVRVAEWFGRWARRHVEYSSSFLRDLVLNAFPPFLGSENTRTFLVLSRFCITQHALLSAHYASIPACLDAIIREQDDPSPRKIPLQILFDVSADRFPSLSVVQQLELVDYFILTAWISWTPDQRNGVLFHIMRYGPRGTETETLLALPLLAWNIFCSQGFQSTSSSSNTIPAEQCLQSVSILVKSSGLNQTTILTLLKLQDYAAIFTTESHRYQFECLNFAQLLRMGSLDRDLVLTSLLQGGIDLNYKGSVFESPLVLFAFHDEGIARILMESGADLSIVTNGLSLLSYAVVFNKLNMTRLLLEKGADPNIRSSRGETALMKASFRGHYFLVQLLLAFGADPGLYNDYGYTAHDLAVLEQRRDVALLLAGPAD